ncbi:MAG: hypothetical protein CXR31_06890 [Geobacter sp.]|nr:MAG: hypothetical protein CXR31_06890 [Geobacter sp.]
MKVEISTLVNRALSGVMPVLSLRGADDLAREGGDLDFIVPSGLAVSACSVVAKAAQSEGFFLAGFRDIGYLAQIILIRPVPGGLDDALKIDFFDGLRWYGVGSDVAGHRLFNSVLPLQGIESKLSGAASFFQKILIVGCESERDWARVVSTGANETYLAEIAEALCLPITRAQIGVRGVTGVDKWLLRAASGGVRGPVSALVWFLRAAAAHLKFKLGTGTGMGLLLGVSGLDGSGKSTLVDRFIDTYRKAGGVEPQLVHLLPSWIPTPHQIFRRHKTKSNYTRPYAEPPVSSRLSGGLRLAFYLCAFAFARLSLWVGMKRGRLIILDRSFLDFASDLTRARIQARRLPDWLLRMMMPSGLLFYLDATPEAVVARKGELTLEKAFKLRMSYLDTCKTIGAKLLNSDETPDAVFRELLSHVSQEYMRRIDAVVARKREC